MKIKNGIIITSGMILFAVLIAAAIFLQSAYLLYAASAIPFLLVPFIPDIPGSQKLKNHNKSGDVRIYRTGSSALDGLIIIDFTPGTIYWNKRRLYFSMEGVETVPAHAVPVEAASVPVLSYDLFRHPRKTNWYGIRLNHLVERLHAFSFTTDEIARLVIRLEDLDQTNISPSLPRTSPVGKKLEA